MCCLLKLHGNRLLRQVNKRVTTEAKTIEKQLGQKQAKRFNNADDAIAATLSLANSFQLHRLKDCQTLEHKEYEGSGRPKKGQKPSRIKYQVIASIQADDEKISQTKASAGHYIIGGNTKPEERSSKEVVEAYKKQHHVVCSFRFLKDPLFFASSLFVKNHKRIMDLLMVMLLSIVGLWDCRKTYACGFKRTKTLTNQSDSKRDTKSYSRLSFFSYCTVFILLRAIQNSRCIMSLKGLQICDRKFYDCSGSR